MALRLSHLVFEPTKTPAASNIPLVILHGLFGSKQNWRSLSKALAQRLESRVIAVDLRNHGESPHSPIHTFDAMGDDLRLLLKDLKIDHANLMGHSMGGKTAMHYALSYQEQINKLVVVDIAPSLQRLTSVFGNYVKQMKKIDQAKVRKPAEADSILSETIKESRQKELSVRQFILTNLKESPDGTLKFRVNLDALGRSLDEDISGFPIGSTGVTYDRDTLFIRGTRADYIPPKSKVDIDRLFPKAKIVDIDAGHWVHAEKPEEFVTTIIDFLKRK
ncbi:hypothetical protein HDU97_007285 [Phlyctochytrium planicorne]|nr:hypothetical protein HDU97_007285 [Phlyctochytrium planicorne]